MDAWEFIQKELELDRPAILMVVVDSQGSSPGRQGFKMAVSTNDIFGSIGGGIMEHKLVEFCKSELRKKKLGIKFMHQYHDNTEGKDQSGMICSGKQSIAFIPFFENSAFIDQVVTANKKSEEFVLQINNQQINYLESDENQKRLKFTYQDESTWQYSEVFNRPFVAHIIGAGHVGLALSKTLSNLGFYIKLYDDRSDLNTMNDNNFAHEKHVIDYTKVEDFIFTRPDDFIVIMSFGYRKDKEIFLQLVDKDYRYIGMMGSREKIEKLMVEFAELNLSSDKLSKLHAPIGINIHSKTPDEIAISIAAELILVKNKEMPSNRKYQLK